MTLTTHRVNFTTLTAQLHHPFGSGLPPLPLHLLLDTPLGATSELGSGPPRNQCDW